MVANPPILCCVNFTRAMPGAALKLLVTACVFVNTLAVAQGNEWTWVSGDRNTHALSVYPAKGTSSPTAKPGAREGAMMWSGKDGGLWLFGGYGRDATGKVAGYLNDLWRFQPSTNEWTWVSGLDQLPLAQSAPGNYGTLGVPAPDNLPPGRVSSKTWTDATGNLWLFGGTIVEMQADQGAEPMNDLWEFNVTAGMWTWMGGSNTPGHAGVYGIRGTPSKSNIPGTCSSGVSWTDSKAIFWLFGCSGNDLWKFDSTKQEWTWVSGSSSGIVGGVYGTLGTPSPNNVPGSRQDALGWSDENGNIWIFGGAGPNPSGPGFLLNDLWEYQPSIDEWTWMGGSNTPLASGYPGNYGLLQSSPAESIPGSRYGALRWTDSKGNLWLYGGIGNDAAGSMGLLNDLWEFSPSTGLWAWMCGDTLLRPDCDRAVEGYCGQPGTYGSIGNPALENRPGSRTDASGVADASGFWLFGGLGFDVFGNPGELNDLWRFQPNTASQKVTATPDITPGTGTYNSWLTVSMIDATPGASISYLMNGQGPTITYTGPITITSSTAITAIASASGYANSNLASAAYIENLPVAATPVFSIASGNYTTAQTVAIASATSSATIYYTTDGTQPSPSSFVYKSPLIVASPQIIRAVAVANGYLDSNFASATYNVTSSQAVPEWTWVSGNGQSTGWYGTLKQPSVTNFPGWRNSAAVWTDKKGSLWLFGGQGVDAVGNQGYLNDLWKFDPSSAQWTWIGGSDTIPNCTSGTCGQPGVYGTVLTPSSANVPSSRWFAVYWTDSKGNLWLFGGEGIDNAGVHGMLNDLWMFNPETLEWTWMSGSSTVPGLYRGAPGIYGVLGTPSVANTPGGRRYAAGWADNNDHLWLYGGQGADIFGVTCDLGDFWRYDISLGQWAWMRGLQGGCSAVHESGQPPVYGLQGTPWIESYPGSRDVSGGWSDRNGTAWLFGGMITDQFGDHSIMNDLWNYDPSTDIWTWVSTDGNGDGGYGRGVYGTLGIAAPSNIPGARDSYSFWIDNSGSFWLFGGDSSGPVDCTIGTGLMNDLWKFNPLIHEWTWMGGSTCPRQSDVFGTLGVPAPTNAPGSNASSGNNWTDKEGNLWLFGGDNNLLWQLGLTSAPAASSPSQASAPTFSLAAGSFTQAQTLTISDATPGVTIYYTTNSTQPSSKSLIYSGPLTISSTQTVTAIAIADNYTRSSAISATYTFNIPQAATPVITPAGGTFTTVQSVTITDASPGASIYYTTDGTAPTIGSILFSAAITVSKSETIQAIATATGYSQSSVASAQFTLNLPPPNFTISGTNVAVSRGSTTGNTSTIMVTPANGFTGNVSLTGAITASPTNAAHPPTLSFGTTTPVRIAGTSATAATLTISTTAATTAALQQTTKPRSRLLAASGALLACFLIFGIPVRRRTLQLLLGLVFLLIVSASGVIACGGSGGGGGGGGGNLGTTPGNYTITVTGTSGTLTETGTLTLTVN